MINFKFDNNKLIVHGKVVQLNNVIDNIGVCFEPRKCSKATC